MANGARLGWLLDAPARQVCVYRPGDTPQRIEHPGELSGGPILPGFILDIPQVWAAMERKIQRG